MEDDLGRASAKTSVSGSRDVGDVERRVGVHLLAASRAQVVDDVHLVAARDERVDERRPDEARSP